MRAQATSEPQASGCPMLRAAADGDGQAIEELYRLHRRDGVTYLRRRGVDDPDGIFDDVFVDVLAKLDTGVCTAAGEYRAYLYRSLRNRAIQSRRRQQLELVELVEADEPVDPGRFDDRVVDRNLLSSCLAQLSNNQREVISRRFLGGERSTEIALDLGRTPESVRQLQRSALLRLRFLLSVGATVVVILALAAVSLILARADRSAPTDPISSTERSRSNQPEDELSLSPDTGRPVQSDPDVRDRTEAVTNDARGSQSIAATADGDPRTPTTQATTAAPLANDTTTTSTPSPDGQPGPTTPASSTVPADVFGLDPTTTTPPAAATLAYEPFVPGAQSLRGFEPSSEWRQLDGTIYWYWTRTGLSYVDASGRGLQSRPGAIQMNYFDEISTLARPLESTFRAEDGYAVSFLIQTRSHRGGSVVWAPGSADEHGAAGIRDDGTIGFLGGDGTSVLASGGQAKLVVLTVDQTGSRLWVNPDLAQPGQPDAIDRSASPDLTRAAFRFEGIESGTYSIDELRIGRSLADVLPYD